MNDLLKYKIFCLESYKSVHKLSGKEALRIFNEYNIFDYISKYFDILHTTGRLYVVKDIDNYLSALH